MEWLFFSVSVVVGSIVPVMPKKSQEILLRGVPDFDSKGASYAGELVAYLAG